MGFIYEVETRFYFEDKKEAYEMFPFLKSSLDLEVSWETVHYGLELFKEDIIIRVTHGRTDNNKLVSLAYKEADIGERFNIRREYSELITDGIKESEILNILDGTSSFETASAVDEELKRLDYTEFMSFKGHSLLGTYEPLDLDFKLMYCESLEYPLLLEVEKEAETVEEARNKEEEILNFVAEYDLSDKLVEKEPPTLLYESVF
ncbi:MAG: hypothetical protein R6V17_04635 [Halanaerobacter sp.]